MKRKKSYKFDEIMKDTCNHLLKKKWDTPAGIARAIGINPKTSQKYIAMGINLGLILSDTMEGNNMLLCQINPKYREIFINLGQEKQKNELPLPN